MSAQQPEWDLALIEKYNLSGPRYTSYPTALEFSTDFSHAEFLSALHCYPQRQLSLYVHLPFCHKLCYFCGCNKIITRQPEKVQHYLDVLGQEIRQRAQLVPHRTVSQLHLGGGTPTYLNKQQITRLIHQLRSEFHFSPDAELAIEIDPRDLDLTMLDHLRSEGFTRLSMGIQDFNKQVQKQVNREQDERVIFALVQHARSIGFTSVNTDLIYGLPKQTPQSFSLTLQRILELSPDRLSVFNYAHMPALFAAQRKIKPDELPSPQQKLEILHHTIQTLTSGGYQYIGMDHFARPDDELAVAQRNGSLQRDFQGYTTRGDTDLLGLGVSAISMPGNSYAQNQKQLSHYMRQVTQQGDALWRGLTLTRDDCIRRDVIKALICHFRLDFAQTERDWGIQFSGYFRQDLARLVPLANDGLLTITSAGINVSGKGRLLIRNICMCFDRYLQQKSGTQAFSRVI